MGGGDNNNNNTKSNNNNSKKKNKPIVQEINGVLWQLDENGNPVKKVKKKSRSDSADSNTLPSPPIGSPVASTPKQSRSASSNNTTNKPTVKEIDGILWQLDENGIPIKKLRRKGSASNINATSSSTSRYGSADTAYHLQSAVQQIESRRRAKSQGPSLSSRGGRTTGGGIGTSNDGNNNGDPKTPKRVRGRSLDGPRQQPGEYIDDKGRKVIVEEDGNKIVFDKNGKRLRPKKKNQVPGIGGGTGGGPLASLMSPRQVTASTSSSSNRRYDNHFTGDDIDSNSDNNNNFDDVWGEKSLHSRQHASSPQRRLYQGMSGPPPDDDDGDNNDMTPADPTSELNTLSHRNLLARTGNSSKNNNASTRNVNSGSPTSSPSNPKNGIVLNENENNTTTTTSSSELKNQIEEYGRENRALKTQLMAIQDEVRNLTQINQKEKAKNVKATTEMLQLKANHQQSCDEKRTLELTVKNLEARVQELQVELEKIENSTPMNRRIGNGSNTHGTGAGGGNGSQGGGGGDHLVSQISDLMAENDALLDKLEFEKASSGHELKKKEEKVLFLNEELKKLREENDMLFRGEAEKDPLMGKLLTAKKELQEKLDSEKEVAKIRIEGLQEMIESLQNANTTLKKDLEKATLEIKDEDDDEIRRAKEMAQAVAQHGTRNAVRARRASVTTSTATPVAQKAFSGFGLNTLTALATSAGRK